MEKPTWFKLIKEINSSQTKSQKTEELRRSDIMFYRSLLPFITLATEIPSKEGG